MCRDERHNIRVKHREITIVHYDVNVAATINISKHFPLQPFAGTCARIVSIR